MGIDRLSSEPDWAWYRSFLRVLETGSLSAAARVLGATQPTVGRHIDQLERALGLKLFTRSFAGFAATDAARELQPYAAGIAATAEALRRVASSHGAGVHGTVRITASEVIGVEILPPILTALRESHPALVIELVVSNRLVDLLHRESDIAVRMVRPVQQALVARRIGRVEIGLHAHRRYLKRHGTPKTLDDLAGHALIGFDQETELTRRVQREFRAFAREGFAWRSDSDLAQLAAIRAGYGIGACQVPLAARDPALVRVLGQRVGLPLETWVVMHEDLRETPRCAVTFAALVKGLTGYLAAG